MLLTSASLFPDINLPVRLFYTHSSIELGWHSHEFVEMAIMLGGETLYETEFSSERISCGDVVVIPPGGIHRYRDENNVSLMNVLYLFDRLSLPYQSISHHRGFPALFRIRPDYYKKMRYYPKFHLEEAFLTRIREILYPAWKDQESALPGGILVVYGAFLQVIPILLRAWENRQEPAICQKLPNQLADAINQMELHFRKRLQMPALAKTVGMSTSAFTRHFKSATGQTPIDYILRLRLQEAAALINEGVPISEAAFCAGFTDSNYFSRVFKKKYGVSPRAFRIMQK